MQGIKVEDYVEEHEELKAAQALIFIFSILLLLRKQDVSRTG
jgi:hypothetical protein